MEGEVNRIGVKIDSVSCVNNETNYNYLVVSVIGICVFVGIVYYFGNISGNHLEETGKIILTDNKDNSLSVIQSNNLSVVELNNSIVKCNTDTIQRINCSEANLGQYINDVLSVLVKNQKTIEEIIKNNHTEILIKLSKTSDIPFELLNDISNRFN